MCLQFTNYKLNRNQIRVRFRLPVHKPYNQFSYRVNGTVTGPMIHRRIYAIYWLRWPALHMSTDCHYLLHPERPNASRFPLGVHTPSFSIKRTYLAGGQSVSTLLTSRIHCCTPLCCRWGRIQLIEPNYC